MALMEKFSTYFGLRLSYTVFGAAEQLSRIIQAKPISIQDAVKAAHTTKVSYEGMRKEEVYSQFYDQVVEDATGKTEEPVLPRCRRAPKRLDGGAAPAQFGTVKEYYRQQYYELLDLLIGELDSRFDQPTVGILEKVETLLLDSANQKSPEIPTDVKELYRNNDLDFERLSIQLKMLPDTLKKGEEMSTINSINKICSTLKKDPVIQGLLSEVHKLLTLYLTVPATSETSERCNSVLKRIKNYLRSTMTQQRTNNTFICHALKQRTDDLDLVEMAKTFVSVNEERARQFGHFQ